MTAPRYIRPARDRFIVEQLSDGSVAVFDRSGDAVHSLNPAAASVWAGCAESASLDDLCDALAEGTTTPLGLDAIEGAVRQLLEAGLLQEVRDASAAVPSAALSSRRQALKKLAGGAAVAVPIVLTLVGKEQRLLAQACGSPSVDLTGCWTGGEENDDPVQLSLTQSGNTITGTIAGEAGLSGTLSGTLCGTTLDFTANVTLSGGSETCNFTVTIHSTNVTTSSFSGSSTIVWGTGCGNEGDVDEGTASFTRGCAG